MIELTTRMEIAASPEKIFDSFVKKDLIGNFWFSHSSSDWAADQDVVLTYDEFDTSVKIHILKLRENRQIALTWGEQTEQRAVTISILPKDEEVTMVEVKEVGFKEYEDLLSNPALAEIRTFEYEDILNNLMGGKGGWTFMLTCLKAYLENGITSLRTGLL